MGSRVVTDGRNSPGFRKRPIHPKNFNLRDLIGDVFAGTIIATSNIALAVSFAAAIFQGDLAGGFTTGVWIMLMTMIVVGLVIGMLTTLPPIAGGPDTAVIAAIGLMAPVVAAPLLAGGMSLADSLAHVMIGITLVAIVSGLAYWALGQSGLGQSLRFVPYPLVAGFLAATGIILITFSVEIVTGERFALHNIVELADDGRALQLAVMLAFALLLGGARKVIRSPLITPVGFFGIALALNASLQTGHFGEPDAWYLQTATGLEGWLPFHQMKALSVDWPVFLTALPELATCVIVGLISLIVRISTFESSRMTAANINHELQIYGGASVLSGLSGGMTGGILFSTSKYLAESSAKTHFVYVVIAAFLAVTIFANFDLAGLVPTPILGGFLLLLGYTMTLEALKVTLRQRAVLEMALTIAIMAVCLWQGFIAGVIVGFVTASLLFAFNYARIGVVRRHSTRQELAAATERAHDIEAAIRKHGDSIHYYELEGYVFFGSSEAVFEQIKRQNSAQTKTPIRCIIVDLSRVTGYDSSAISTLNKLRGHCNTNSITLIICGIDEEHFKILFEGAPFQKENEVLFFPNAIESLDWAEQQLLGSLDKETKLDDRPAELTAWLSAEFGVPVHEAVIDGYFDRRETPAGTSLYQQGAPADTIDFIVSGTVSVMVDLGAGRQQCVRRSSRQTVVGEMGFFREAERAATVVAETPVVIYTLSRSKFEKLKQDHLLIHDGLLNFIIRILSDRLDMATSGNSARRNVGAVNGGP